jgi:hypothetical protein
MMGGGGGLLGLLRIEKVQEELKIDADQKKELEATGQEIMDATREMFAGAGGPRGGGGGGGGGQFSEEDRKRMQENMEKLTKLREKAESKLEDILDPMQMDRLLGLFVQRDNYQTLSNKLIQAKIKFTSAQETKLKDVEKENNEANQKAMSEMRGGGGDRDAMREKMTALRKENEDRVAAILTDEQKKTMEEMKGPKFEFPAPTFGGPGGPGGPGGGRGRGGNDN